MNSKIEELQAEINDLKKRMPAHSVKPEMIDQLEKLEEELERLQRSNGKSGGSAMGAPERLVIAATFSNPNEAHIFKGLLDSEGIVSFIYDERSAMAAPVFMVRVAVRQSDLARARELLAVRQSNG